MSEERQPHPQEPAEGAPENERTPGADRPEEGRGAPGVPGDEERSSRHPQEPAEGGDESTEAPGADRPGGEKG